MWNCTSTLRRSPHAVKKPCSSSTDLSQALRTLQPSTPMWFHARLMLVSVELFFSTSRITSLGKATLLEQI